jgi:integrase
VGSVSAYDTADGKRYRVRYRKPDHSSTDKRGFRTQREARAFLATVEVSMHRGEYVDPTASRVTIGTLGAEWLTNQTHLKPSSLDPVQRAWRLHVEPVWGRRALGQVRHSEVQAWVTELSSRKSATVVLRAHGVLASILETAVRDRRVMANVARGVNLPRKVPKARVYLGHDQVERLALQSGQHATLVRTLAYTGLRWGEAIGLQVKSLDFLRRRALVEENAVRVGGGISVGTPKGHAIRSVPVPAFLLDELAHLCKGKRPNDLLFGDGQRHLQTPSSRDGWFDRAVVAAMGEDATMPRVTPHDLRHTAASLAISAGANVKAVQRMLGHKSAAMTLDTYSDLFDDDLDAVGAALDQARTASSVGKVWARAEADGSVTPLLRRASGAPST